MSIFSDYDCGAMSDDEFRDACRRMDREEKYYLEHEFDDLDDEEEEDDSDE